MPFVETAWKWQRVITISTWPQGLWKGANCLLFLFFFATNGVQTVPSKNLNTVLRYIAVRVTLSIKDVKLLSNALLMIATQQWLITIMSPYNTPPLRLNYKQSGHREKFGAKNVSNVCSHLVMAEN